MAKCRKHCNCTATAPSRSEKNPSVRAAHFFLRRDPCGARHHRQFGIILDTVSTPSFLYDKEGPHAFTPAMSSDVDPFPHLQTSPHPEAPQSPSSPTTMSVGTKRRGSRSPNSSQAAKRKRNSSSDDEPSQSNSEDDGDTQTTEKKTKRQQRLLKNREAAQQFRQRQKNYIQELEKKVDSLVSENQQFTSKAELLQSENHLLRDQLSYLRGFMTHVMSAFSNKVPGAEGMSAMGPGVPSPFGFASPSPAPSPMAGADPNAYGVPSASGRLPMYQSNPASVAAAFQAAIGLAPAGPTYDPRHVNRSDRHNGEHP